MTTTPEGRVKAAIKKVLSEFQHYGYWPVPAGYGESTLDYVGIINGFAFAIEVKAENKRPTARQDQIISRIRAAGGKVFIIAGTGSPQIQLLREFLTAHTQSPE